MLGPLLIWLLAPFAASHAADTPTPMGPGTPAAAVRGAPGELLFRARLDGPSADADFARGNPRSSLGRPLEGRPGRGDRGGALVLRDGERCEYEAAGNLDLSSATVSLWVRPETWQDSEGRYQKFFDVPGVHGGRPFDIYVDSPPGPRTARLVMILGYPQTTDYRLYQIHATADWKPGVWHKIDVTWSPSRLAIYVDGQPGETLEIQDPQLPRDANSRFSLVPIFHHGDGRYHRGSDRSAIDQVEIHRGALGPDQILERYLADVEEPPQAPLVRVPRARTSVVIDGRASEPAWQEASQVPLLAEAETGFAASRVAHTRLVYGEEALFLSFSSDPPAPASVAVPALAGGEPRADAFLLWLRAPSGALSEWSLTAAGARRRQADGGWAVDPQARFAQTTTSDAWTVELALPWAVLGSDRPRPGDEWSADLGRRWARAAGGSFTACWVSGGAEERSTRPRGRLLFDEEQSGVRLTLGDRLCCGSLDGEAEAEGGGRVRLALQASGDEVFQRQKTFVAGQRFAEPIVLGGPGELAITIDDAKRREALALRVPVLARRLLDVTPLPRPEEGRLGLEIGLSSLAADWLGDGEQARLRVALEGPAGERGEREVPLGAALETLSLPFAFAAGEHRLRVTLVPSDGRSPLQQETPLRVPPLPWAGSRLGEGDEVLEPWTPIVQEAPDALSVWGRRYAFDGPLLRGVTQQGRELLRAPIQLRITTERGSGALRTIRSQVRRSGPQRVESEGRGDFGAEAGMGVGWSTWTEYDGLSVARITLEPPPGGLRVDSLVLEIPLRPDVVRHLRGSREGGGLRTGRVAWNGQAWRSGFEPFVWVTNEEEGFLFFSESEANWVYDPGARVVSVYGGAVARIELAPIRRPVRVDRPLRYEFGFQATPVKPLAADRREWNFGGHVLARHQNALNWFPGYAVQDGLFEPARPADLRLADERWRARGVRVLYFGTTGAMPDHNPVFELFEPLWRGTWAASYPNQDSAATALRPAFPGSYGLVGVCPGAESFQDMVVHQAASLLRETGAAGIYTDTDDLFADDNTRHGHGFRDAFGRSGLSWPFLDKRRLAKRLAAVVRTAGPGRRYWMSHAHARLVPPVHGFADFFLPGEELNEVAKADPWLYADSLDEAAWRVEYRGESSGLVHVLLPELPVQRTTASHPEARAASEALLGLAAVHDVNVENGFIDTEAIGDYWQLRERLGLASAEFVGHWRPDALVRAEPATVRASAYRTGRGLVIPVANPGPLPQEGRLVLDLERAKLRGSLRARDERRGRELGVQDGSLVVPLDARSYTFVTLRGDGA